MFCSGGRQGVRWGELVQRLVAEQERLNGTCDRGMERTRLAAFPSGYKDGAPFPQYMVGGGVWVS
jgi:hypothetical protein